MLKLTKIKLHNQGTLYKKFTFKNVNEKEAVQQVGYLRIAGEGDPEWSMYEMLHVYSTTTIEHDRGGIIKRVIEEKVHIESFRHKAFLALLPSMNIIEEFVTIPLHKFEEVLYAPEGVMDISQQPKKKRNDDPLYDYMYENVRPTEIDINKTLSDPQPLSTVTIDSVLKTQEQITELLVTDNGKIDKTQILAEVTRLQSLIQLALRE